MGQPEDGSLYFLSRAERHLKLRTQIGSVPKAERWDEKDARSGPALNAHLDEKDQRSGPALNAQFAT